MPLIRYIQKLTRDPNFLVWRDTVYVNADGRPQYLSLKLVSDIDALLQGKISEYVFQSEFREVKFSCDEINILCRNLVAEYLMYEGSGTVLHDTSGNKRNITHPCSWGQLLNGKYYLIFDGTKAINTNLTPQQLCISSEYTLEFIYKRTDYNPTQPENGIIYFSRYFHEFRAFQSDDRHDYAFYDGQHRILETTLSLNKWYHIILRARSNDTADYIVNNVVVKTSQVSALQGFYNAWYIGGDPIWNKYYSKMNLALIRVFNVKVSDTVRNKLWELAQIAVPELA